MSGRRAGARGAGFTLVEVVIALTLVSLVMLGLVSALSTFGATAAKLDERVGRSGEARLVTDFLRGTLSRSVRDLRQLLPDGSRHVFFRGGGGELVWLGNMPARHGVGGLHHFRLSVMEEYGRPFLALQYAPYIDDQSVPDWSQIPPHILAEHAASLQVAYQSKPLRPEEEAEWFPAWEDGEHLPGRLRIDISADGQHWPPLIVTLDSADAARGGVRIVNGPVE